jgi:hypothetical protein
LQLRDRGRGLGIGDAQRFERSIERCPSLLEVVHGAGARQCLDAAHARADARLFRDHKRSDVARRPHVRAAAELDAEPGHGDDPHLLAVLLSEEGHRAGLDRLLGGSLFSLHGPVQEHLLVDHVLDGAPVVLRQRLDVRDVEAQPVGRDEGAGLPHVRAEPGAQGGVELMGGGVVAARRIACGFVDLGPYQRADRQRCRGPHLVHTRSGGRQPCHCRHLGHRRAVR